MLDDVRDLSEWDYYQSVEFSVFSFQAELLAIRPSVIHDTQTYSDLKMN